MGRLVFCFCVEGSMVFWARVWRDVKSGRFRGFFFLLKLPLLYMNSVLLQFFY